MLNVWRRNRMFLRTVWLLIGCMACWESTCSQQERTSQTSEWLFADPQQVTTTATRSAHKVYESFTTVRILTREEMRLAGVQTVQEALERLVPDLESQEGAVNRFISVRGAYTSSEFNERTLILLDGIPLNDAILGTFPLMALPIADIERVEIAFGPGSAMYGPNAFAGVVNILTRSPEVERESDWQNTYGGAGSYHSSFRYRSGPQKSRFAYTLGGTLFSDPGSNRVRNNDTDLLTLHFASSWTPSDGSDWRFQYRYFDLDRGSVGLTGTLVSTPHDRYQPRSHLFALSREQDTTHSKQTSRFYGQVGDLRFVREMPPGSDNLTTLPLHWGTLGFDNLWQWNRHHHSITIGTELRHYWASGSLLPGRTSTNFALLAQWEQQAGRWNPLIGTRVDTHSLYGGQFSPRVGLTYRLSANSILRTSYGRAFRAPNFAEMFADGFVVWSPAPGDILVPVSIYGDENLKPETITSFEVGWKHTTSSGWQFDASYFRNELNDLVDLTVRTPDQPDPTQVTYENLKHVRLWGWAAEIAKPMGDHLDIAMGYARVFARDSNNSGSYGSASPHRFLLKVAVHNANRWGGQLLLNYPARHVGGEGAYAWNAHLNLVYALSDNVELSLRVDNLLNTPQHLSYILPGSGRSFRLQLNCQW